MRPAGRHGSAAALAVLLLSAGCPAPPDAPPAAVLRFTDAAAESGLGLAGPSFAAAAADYDRDGWPDLAVSAHGAVRLFHNRGGRFEDVAPALGFPPADTHGLSWIDLDRDGRLDLAVAVGAQRGFGRGDNQVYRNLGGGTLRLDPEVPEVLRDPLGRGRCVVPLDLDRDGRLEVAVVNLVQEGRWSRLARPAAGGGWEPAPAPASGDLARLEAACLAAVPLEGLDGPGVPVLIGYGGGAASGRAFRPGPGGALADVTAELGIPALRHTVYAVAAGDYDNDGDLDLYLVHGHHVRAELVPRDGGLGFRLIARERGDAPGFTFACAGEVAADVAVGNRRDPAAVFLGAALAHPPAVPWTLGPDAAPGAEPAAPGELPAGLHLRRPSPGEVTVTLVGDGGRVTAASGVFSGAGCSYDILAASDELRWPRPATPNVLLRNDGGRFEDVTAAAGVGDRGSGRDAVFFDADDDGDLDLFVVNGGAAFGQQPDVLYLNRGDGGFADLTAEAGVAGADAGRGATVTALDSDRDGDLDLFVTNGDGPPLGNQGPYTLWRNATAPRGRSLEVDLEGGPDNPFALGARVLARFGGRRLLAVRSAGNGRFSTGVLPLHFGLGDAGEAAIEVRWPSGRTSEAAARAGERLVLAEPAAGPGAAP